MFIAQSRGGYTRDGSQWGRGQFLLVFDHPTETIWLGTWKCTHCYIIGHPGDLGPCGTQYSRRKSLQDIEDREILASMGLTPRPPVPAIHQWTPYRAPALYACVRYVRLRQLGHWMMGSAKIGGHTVGVSGAYGSDGLPSDWPKAEIAKYLHPIPPDVARAFWHGGGHNTCGAEAPRMRAWAQANIEQLLGAVTPKRRRPHQRTDHNKFLESPRSDHQTKETTRVTPSCCAWCNSTDLIQLGPQRALYYRCQDCRLETLADGTKRLDLLKSPRSDHQTKESN